MRERSVEDGMMRLRAPPFPEDEIESNSSPVSVRLAGKTERSRIPPFPRVVEMEENLEEVREREKREEVEDDGWVVV